MGLVMKVSALLNTTVLTIADHANFEIVIVEDLICL